MKILFLYFCLSFLVVNNCSACGGVRLFRMQVCKENVRQVCRDYDDFLAWFYNERNWKVSPDFFPVPKYKIKEGDPKHDPLSDQFYDL